MHLDMVYGLLHRRIRQKIRRDEVQSFDNLLKLARVAAEVDEEDQQDVRPRTRRGLGPIAEEKKERPRCKFCRNFGHLEDDCRKRKASETRKQIVNSPDRSELSWYGCGATGVIRSKCAKCRQSKPSTSANPRAEFRSLCATAVRPRARPMLGVTIRGSYGTDFVDTVAQQSVASILRSRTVNRELKKY